MRDIKFLIKLNLVTKPTEFAGKTHLHYESNMKKFTLKI